MDGRNRRLEQVRSGLLLPATCPLCSTPADMFHASREVVKDFRGSASGREVLKATMTQLLLYYTRVLELLKRAGPEAAALVRDAVTVPSIMYEIKKFNR